MNQIEQILFINTIGLCVLMQNLKSAAYYISHTNANIYAYKRKHEFLYRMQDGSASYAFINGSGLEIMLEQYALDYNAEELRSGFFYAMRKMSNGH